MEKLRNRPMSTIADYDFVRKNMNLGIGGLCAELPHLDRQQVRILRKKALTTVTIEQYELTKEIEMPNHRYTDEERAIITNNMHLPASEILLLLPHLKLRQINGILSKARMEAKVKVHNRNHQDWQPGELEILSANLHLNSSELSALLPGVKIPVIQAKARQMRKAKEMPAPLSAKRKAKIAIATKPVEQEPQLRTEPKKGEWFVSDKGRIYTGPVHYHWDDNLKAPVNVKPPSEGISVAGRARG